MRRHEPFRLTHLDPQRAATEVLRELLRRARRDASRLGLALPVDSLPAGSDEQRAMWGVMRESEAYKAALVCATWAATGTGRPKEIAAALKELCADLDGVEPGEVSKRAPNLATVCGVLAVAAAARLALVEGRTVSAVEVATLASRHDRTIRAMVKAGTLEPIGKRRPMRFAADVVCQYLYTQGVPGFVAPPRAPTA